MDETPAQTVGPFFHVCLPYAGGGRLVPDTDPGAIRVAGTVYDEAGDVVPDALVEVWQADPAGRYHHPDDDPRPPGPDQFTGFGRVATDASGRFELVTVKPGPVPGPGGTVQAPHVNVTVFARGLLQRLTTRMYFADEAEANSADPVLGSVDVSRRETLVAVGSGSEYRFDIRLRGPGETVFLAV